MDEESVTTSSTESGREQKESEGIRAQGQGTRQLVEASRAKQALRLLAVLRQIDLIYTRLHTLLASIGA